VRIKGRVLTEPVGYDYARFIKVNGLHAYVDLFPEINYGDKVVLEGIVEDSNLKNAKVIETVSGGGLYFIRQKILSIFKKGLPEPHASLVSGIVLGSKTDMPTEFWESLKATGTAHVVVASGMNVTLVTSFLVNSLVHFIKRQKAIIIALAGAWVYVILSGFDAPLVRAAIMGSIAFGAQGVGRLSMAFRALILSAGIMLFLKPEWVYDLGFILSFVATLSLIVFEPKISILLSKIPFVLKKDLATTIAAQIGATPILFVTFGNFNPLSPLANALVLWCVPPIMIIGGIAGIAGLAIPSFGQFITMLTLPFSAWFVGIVRVFS
jgi:competence protein ComEC